MFQVRTAFVSCLGGNDFGIIASVRLLLLPYVVIGDSKVNFCGGGRIFSIFGASISILTKER